MAAVQAMPPTGPPPDGSAAFDPLASAPPPGSGGRIVALVVVAFVALVVLLVGGIFLFTQGDDSGEGSDQVATEADEPERTTEPTEPRNDEFTGEPSDTAVDETVPPTVPQELDLFRDPTPYVEVVTEAVGPGAMVYEVGVYPTHGRLSVRDPSTSNRVHEYTWVNQELDGPEPALPFPGTDLDTDTFPLRSIAFDRLPLLVRRAPERVGISGGHVTHVLMDRAFTAVPTMRIYVSSADDVESDYALATLDGRFTDR